MTIVGIFTRVPLTFLSNPLNLATRESEVTYAEISRLASVSMATIAVTFMRATRETEKAAEEEQREEG